MFSSSILAHKNHSIVVDSLSWYREGIVFLDDLTSYAGWNFNVPGSYLIFIHRECWKKEFSRKLTLRTCIINVIAYLLFLCSILCNCILWLLLKIYHNKPTVSKMGISSWLSMCWLLKFKVILSKNVCDFLTLFEVSKYIYIFVQTNDRYKYCPNIMYIFTIKLWRQRSTFE